MCVFFLILIKKIILFSNMTFTKINRIYNDINESSNPDPDPGTIDLQSKSVEITENGNSIITADPNYDGLSSVNLSVNVQSTPSFTIPEYDITKFYFSKFSRDSSGNRYVNIFSNSYTINKQNGSYTEYCCFIYEMNNTIILSFGIPPIGAYYCINTGTSSDSIIKYDNIIINNGYVYFNREYSNTSAVVTYYNTITLFGKLINLPE